jgi:MFS family permease
LTIEAAVIAVFLSTLDVVMMAPALPAVMAEYRLPVHWAMWVIALPLAFFSYSLPVLEGWAVQSGRNKVMRFSLFLYAAGALIAAVSHPWVWFMWGRVIQAVGAGGIVPYVSLRVRHVFRRGSQSERRGLFWKTGILLLAAPLFSTGLVREFGWRSVFFEPLFLSALLFFLSRRPLIAGRKERPWSVGGESGVFFGLIHLFLLTAVTVADPAKGLKGIIHPDVLPLWLMAVGLTVPLWMVERQKAFPYFAPRLRASGRLWLLYGQVALGGFVWMALVLVPDVVIHRNHLPVWWIGGILALLLLTAWLMLPLVLFLSRVWKFKWLSAFGFLLAAVAYALMAWRGEGWTFAVALVLVGSGLSFALGAPVHTLLFDWLPSEKWRRCLMALGMFRAAGGALGLAVTARLFTAVQQEGEKGTGGIFIFLQDERMLVFAAAAALFGFAVSLALPGHSR